MGLNTDLHAAPYFDDFDESKNYHMIPFKPTLAVQARELNQLQTILQNQIERFGDNILKKGTIVKGGNFYDYTKIAYVKIGDSTVNGDMLNLKNYEGATLTGVNSGVSAYVMTYFEGSTSSAPNLNTLYVKYTKSNVGTNGNDQKTFLPGEILQVSVGGVIQPDVSVNVANFSMDQNPIGYGYAVSCGDGVIYQKGYFVRFENQIAVVSKYDTVPDNVCVGFVTEETIVTALEDNTLYNNADGFYNTNTTGADRLKLTPKLVVYNKTEVDEDENFFTIQEYQGGRLVRKNTDTEFNSINKELEKRTSEESGNYSVTGYNITATNDRVDPTQLKLNVSAGVSYVNGKRVETVGPYTLDIRSTTDFETVSSQDVLANYGNFIYTSNLIGMLPFMSMGTVNLYSAVQVASSLVGFTPVGTSIGTAKVLSYDVESYGRYRIYLFDIKMTGTNFFSNVKSIYSPSNGFANIMLESGKAVLKDTSFKSLIFPLGNHSIKEIVSNETDYIFRNHSSITVGTSGVINLTVGGDELFPYTAGSPLTADSIRDILITNSTSGVAHPIISATVDGTGTSMTVSIGPVGSSFTANVVYNVKKLRVRPTGKQLKTVYMRINANLNVGGTYYMGWPDVHSIEGVWKGANTTFTEASAGITNVTTNFTLNKNANEMYYAISYIKKKPAFTITNADRFLVKAKVYVKEVTGSYSDSFFCVNSYPVDDESTTLPANKIRTETIPSNLRNSIDFRPYANNTAAYSETAGGATISTNVNTLAAVNFGSSNVLSAPNKALETSYSYYLARRDILTIDALGDFTIIEGEVGTNPTYPKTPAKSMLLANIYMPPFPALSPSVAAKSGNIDYGVKIVKSNNRRYTMKDISSIEGRLDNIEYYTILNALEKSADDMVIKDANGLNRFKNGIFVDNFDNMTTCDVKNPDFGASVDVGESALFPRFRAYNLEFRNPVIAGGVTLKNPGLASIDYKEVVMDQQLYATKYRSCVTNFYNYSGNGFLSPEYDNGYDETIAPDVSLNIDLSSVFADYTEALSEFVPLTTSASSSVSTSSTTTTNRTTNVGNITRPTSTTTTSTTTSTTTTTNSATLTNTGDTVNTNKVGDFITNFSISPYLRANLIKSVVYGLKPNTRFWVWFDGTAITDKCATLTDGDTFSTMKRNSVWGAALRSDAAGVLRFIINLPGETFYVGDRDVMVMDVDNLLSEDAATSRCVMTYRGFNYSVEKTGLEIATRTPNYDSVKTQTVNTSVTTTTIPFTRVIDPISQTFYVDPSYTNSDSVMITKVNVAFKRKSVTAGVSLQIRRTSNGYPAGDVLPFGNVRLAPSAVSVSDDGRTYTSFKFSSPVTLAAGESYCIVVMPEGNSPDYLIHCAQNGQNDFRTGTKIVSDVHNGTLFTSTNNMAWTPYQDENLTFIIYKAEYTSNSGNVYLSPNDYEFLNISTFTGNFSRGETAFVLKTNNTGTITTVSGSANVVGVGTSFVSNFVIGDFIAIYNSTNQTYEVSRINSILNNTNMVLDEVAKVSMSARTYFKTVTGIVDYFNKTSPVKLLLKESSAKSGSIFANGDTVLGELSGATATIGEVSYLPISHYQSNIMKTVFNKTDVKMFYDIQTDLNGTRTMPNLPHLFGDNNRLSNVPTVIMSRSYEVANYAGARSMRLRLNIALNGNAPYYVSPIIDYEISSITAFEYLINPYTTDVDESERYDGGTALTKYISKPIVLREGFDAEDIKVWLTAYRPVLSDINVYVKFISEIDQTLVDSMPWTKLKMLDSSNLRSASNNLNDFKELEFSMNNIVLGNNEGAYQNNDGFEYKGPNGEIYENYKTFVIKIVMNSSGHNNIPKVRDIRAVALT